MSAGQGTTPDWQNAVTAAETAAVAKAAAVAVVGCSFEAVAIGVKTQMLLHHGDRHLDLGHVGMEREH